MVVCLITPWDSAWSISGWVIQNWFRDLTVDEVRNIFSKS